jgi:c-di-GMP-binding flagellar brake protein YcgR
LSHTRNEISTEIITASSYIAALLQRVVSERLLVSVKLADNDNYDLTSTLLQILPQESAFLLDDLFPLLPPELALQPASTVNIDAVLSGARVKFKAIVQSIQEEGGLRLCRVAFPESVEYQQERNEHRIEVLSLEIPVRLFVGEGVVLQGLLQDLSSQGVALRLAKVAGLKRGKAYRCSIEHSDNESVEIEIEPNRVEKADGVLPLKLGAVLHNMSKHELWQWQRFVTEIERRLLRRQ